MADELMDGPDDQIELKEQYSNRYNEIVQPDRVFVATQYFRKKWVPLLGPDLAWLIIELRQRCYWNRKTGEARQSCLVSQAELGEATGLDRRHIQKLIQRPYANQFILAVEQRYEYNPGLGKTVRAKSCYSMRMDDPLVEEDEKELLAGGDLSAKSTIGSASYAPKAPTVYAPKAPTSTSTSITPDDDGVDEQQVPEGPAPAKVKELRQWLLGIGYSEQNAESLALKALEQGLTLRGARAWWEHIRQHNSQRGRNKIRSPLGFLMAKLQSGDRLPEERVRELLPFESVVPAEEEPAALPPVPTESQRVWGNVLAELERTLTRAQYDSYLFGTMAERRNGSWLVECTNKLQVDWMTHRLKPLVERTLSAVVGEPSHVEFVAKERTG